MLRIEALERDKKEDVKDLRSKGIIPAVYYGPKEDAQSIKVDSIKFGKVFAEAGESTIVELKIGDTSHEVLIHAIDRDPVKDNITHVDFYVIERGKELEVTVPLVFEGVAPAEKNLGGVLVKVMHDVEVKSLPRHLPHELTVDISALVDFDSQIQAKDIKLPEGVSLTVEPEEVVALVQEPKEEELDEPVEAPDMDSIEVAGKKPEAEESEEDSKE